jgi:uncharacterized membrane protein YagU involved in acid resistance
LAGALDLAAAIVSSGLRGVEPLRLMQSIASGVLGSSSYELGIAAASLGVLLHFLIMFVICAVFYAASRRLSALTKHPVVWGAIYGVAVYLVMNFVVLPLSAFPHQIAYTPTVLITGMTILVFCVGLPISLVTKRYA